MQAEDLADFVGEGAWGALSVLREAWGEIEVGDERLKPSSCGVKSTDMFARFVVLLRRKPADC